MCDVIQALKRDFYRYHFGDFLMFLDNPSLEPCKNYMSYRIAAINERCDFQLYDGDNPPYMELHVNPQRAVAAVEEFFDMMENAGTALQDVTHILKYLKDPAGYGTIADMDDLVEDRIVRVICYHFWDLLERRPLEATKYQQKHYGAKEYGYSDYSINDLEYSRMINGPIMAFLTYRYGLFVPFLRVAKDIRNQSTHSGQFFDQAEGYLVYRYILFTYIATVLLIRKAQFQNAPYNIPEIKMYIDGSYSEIKLLKNKKELTPQSTEDGRTYFNVRWYQNYKLEIEGKSIEFTLTCNDWEPSASKVGDEIRTYSNDYQVDNDAHSASFHQAMDAFEKAVVELRDISRNTEDVPKIYGLIEKTIEQQEHQNSSLEYISGLLNEISQALQKGQEERNKDLAGILGPQYEILAKTLNNQATLHEDHEQIKRTQTMILNNQEDERTRKETQKNNTYWGLLIGALVIAVGACLWHGLKDLSLQWLTHQWAYIVTTVALLGIAVFTGTYLRRMWKEKKPVWKRWLPAGMALLTCAFTAGAYLLTPALTYESFVKKYDFARHEPNENAVTVAYLKGQGHLTDEATLKQLATYYYQFVADSLKEAMKYAKPLSDLKRYPEGCLIAAEVLLASKDYSGLGSLIEVYNKQYGDTCPILNRIAGLQRFYGWGQEKNMKEGYNLLLKAAYYGDVDAYYYLGHISSHDYTDWRDGEVVNKSEVWLDVHFPKAVHCFRVASRQGYPRASLQLGKLYADLNMKDSAKCYYDEAIKQCEKHPGQLDSERVRLAALFQKGLVKVNEGDTLNNELYEAELQGYEPALLYSALRQKDHKRAIGLYEKMGVYKGYRYIPPIVFEYIAIGDSTNALNALQSARPHGGFNKEFVSALQRMEGNKYVLPDSVQWLNYMRQSAEKGCKFAQLCCYAAEGIKNEQEFHQFNEVCREVPFGYSLKSIFYNLAKHDEGAFESAAKAISHGHPFGPIAFCSIDHFNVNQHMMDSTHFIWWQYCLFQMITRMVSNAQIAADAPSLKQMAIENALYYYQKAKGEFKPAVLSFWGDVAKANHLFNIECFLAAKCTSDSVLELRQEILRAALENASPDMNQDDLDALSWLIQDPNFDLRERLANIFKGDDFRYHLIYPNKSLIPNDSMYLGDQIRLFTSYDIRDLVHEFSNLLDDYYEFALSEDDMVIPGINTTR